MNSILVTEDEAEVRQLLVSLLQRAGYSVTTAENGREAVDTALRERPDLVLLDVTMPEMDGFTAMERMKAEPTLAASVIVLLTARDSPADLTRGWDSGSDLYLTKPFHPTELLDYIAAIFSE